MTFQVGLKSKYPWSYVLINFSHSTRSADRLLQSETSLSPPLLFPNPLSDNYCLLFHPVLIALQLNKLGKM